MALDDLPLDRPTPAFPSHAAPPPPEPERGSLLRWIAVALAGVIAGGLLTFWWMSRSQPTPAAAPSSTAPEAAARTRPVPQPLNLPTLDNSDAFIRDLVSTLSNHPTLARLLASDAIVRSAAVGVLQIGDGRTPVEWLQVLRPGTRMQITGDATGTVTPESHARWTQAANVVTTIAPADAAQLYVNVKPLLDAAYVELGAGRDFDQAIVRAVRTLKDTPDPSPPPQLLRRPGYFEFEDPTLRTLRPVQKQLLLLGPDNRRQLMGWLDQFLQALAVG
jgi:Protein of unknown function (DUF3014)